MAFFAHSLPNRPETEWEPLEVHLRNVAVLAQEFANRCSAGEWGWLAGLWHDIGKYQPEFQARLRDKRIHAPHAGFGAALANERHPRLGQILAFVIAGHHAGLTNRENSECAHLPLKTVVENYSSVLRKIEPYVDRSIYDVPLPPVPTWLQNALKEYSSAERMECWAFFTRMLFSALVDADRIETARFYAAATKSQAVFDRIQYDSIVQLRDRLDTYIDRTKVNPDSTPVNRLRKEVLDACREAAVSGPGFFSLTVPTGGGKTLSGMSFALRHAVRNKLERVIVVIPFTSIITQNAHCYQDAFGELAFSGKSNVLEHHSAIDQQKRAEEHSEQELLRQTAAENWDAPVVVTTTVQFFESQFSNHPSRCRKLHRIARSVIILDEVQTLPPRLLLPILHALKQLVRHYGCSIVLSTATPPALEARSSFAVGLKNVTPIIKDAGKLFSSPAARRVAVEWRIERPTPYEDIAAEMATHQQALTIVHLRKDARQLCELLQPEGRFHLSALMCPAHRIERIAAVDNQLKARHVCRLVSTQLIEAGVDVDFPVVYRALAGLDSLAQSAGRCDREGLRTLRAGKPAGRFIIFRAITQPPPGTLRKGVETTQKLFELQSSEPRLVGGLDLLNPDHALLYFEQFYELNHLDQNQVLREIGELNFATISEKFQMIADNGMRSIVVPWKEGRERAARYQAEPSLQTVRALQPYLVQVNKMYFDNIAGRGMIEVADNSIGLPTPLFSSDWYSDEFGLQPDPQADISPDALIL